MTQTEFYKDTVAIIAKQGPNKDPKQMAMSIYFHMKQYPENVKQDAAWGVMMKNIKSLLTEEFEWEMTEIHTLFINLCDLTKYMEKST